MSQEQKPTLGRFRIKAGQHENYKGDRFKKDDVCEDKIDLAQWAPEKFERVASDTPLSKPLPKLI